MMKHPYIFLLLVLLTGGCLQTQSTKEDSAGLTQTPEPIDDSDQVISLLGKAFNELPLSESEKTKREQKLAEAQQNYENNPDSLENIIWYGRRLGYLGRFKEAIRIYSVGLDKYPDSYRLLRHRGHRYITIREFDKAIEDLQKAAFYSRPYDNEIEPDGLPNRLNKPLSNTKFNIWYHLGISYYLKGNYDKAISSFKQCKEFADNSDLLVANTDWFYLTYRKIGNIKAAEQLLADISRRMTLIENEDYHRRLLLYKGVITPDQLLAEATKEMPDMAIEATKGYGLGIWYAYHGKLDESREVLFRITTGPRWDAFGFIAAEVDLLSLKDL